LCISMYFCKFYSIAEIDGRGNTSHHDLVLFYFTHQLEVGTHEFFWVYAIHKPSYCMQLLGLCFVEFENQRIRKLSGQYFHDILILDKKNYVWLTLWKIQQPFQKKKDSA
jgi:hypothetical protein